jgi:hypothetical protein
MTGRGHQDRTSAQRSRRDVQTWPSLEGNQRLSFRHDYGRTEFRRPFAERSILRRR